MTVTPTYPGVYLQEIPSGNRTVTGVATSIAAFVGTAPRGSVDDPVPISGFGDFERAFGGLTRTSGLGYAVRDYFLNGGSDALVVRVVHHKDPAKDAKDVGAVPARLTVDGLTLEASGPGAWGNALHAKVEYLTATVAADVAAGQGVSPNALFILTVSEGMGADAPTETYVNVTTTDGPQRLDLVLASSRLVRVSGTLPTVRPAAGEYDVARLPVDTLPLGPGPDAGPWSGGVKATVTRPTAGDALNEAAKQQGVKATDLFNLALEGTGAKIKEPYDLCHGGRRAPPGQRRPCRVGGRPRRRAAADRSAEGRHIRDRQGQDLPRARRRPAGGRRLHRRRGRPHRDAGAAQGGPVHHSVHPAPEPRWCAR